MSVASPRNGERGFTLIEALIAAGILTVVVLCAMAAVSAAARATARAAPRAILAETAQNVLADLRAASAYDPAELADLAAEGSRRVALEEEQADGSGLRQAVTTEIVPNAAGAGYLATVTVKDVAGNTVTLRSTLVQEAPAPGSVVPLSSPLPAGGPSSAGASSAAAQGACLLGRGCRVLP
jgi:Tfp pilus assembly protein PilV